MSGSSRIGNTAAKGIISGEISNGVTWVEDIEVTEDGTAIAGTPEDWDWTLTLRRDYTCAADLTLDLSVTQGTESTVLEVRCPKASLSGLCGDYIIDIKSVDTTDTTVDSVGLSKHWGHGSVTVRDEPI